MPEKKKAGRPRLYNTPAERQKAYRERVKENGGRIIKVALDFEAARWLELIAAKEGLSDQDAINYALTVAGLELGE